MRQYSLFSYKKGNSLLHKCPTWLKMFFLFALNFLYIFLPFEFALVMVGVQIIVASCLHFSFLEQLCDIKPVLFYAVMLGFFCVISRSFKTFNYISLIKILAAMQSASLMCKTSTSLEMKEGIAVIFGQNSINTLCVFMFMNFLPMVGKLWLQCKKSWIARGGKKSIKMYVVLLPVLLSVGLKKSYDISRAVLARRS